VGRGVSGVLASMDLVGARIMDEDTRRYGVKREGIYSSVGGFMNRLNGFFISFAYLLVKSLYGYESGDAPGPDPGGAARFLLVIFPFGAMLISCAFSRFLRFPELDGPRLRKNKVE
jgi:GPH family glycoside/pentoside/hexuronide:cation symporter